jgi:hypothetical protein
MGMLYSLVATAPAPIILTKPPITLEAGRNVFTALTDDIEGLVATLVSLGAAVLQVNALTQPRTTPSDMVLDGESPVDVLGVDYGGR